MNYSDFIDAIKAIKKPRKIIALAGAPASGKSTVAKIKDNDLPNAELVMQHSVKADFVFTGELALR